MEANYGILSIIPAVIVIGLSLYTKKTIMSLMIGTFIGVTILSGWNPLVAVVAFFRDFMYPNLTSVGNLKTILIIFILQGFVKMLKLTGAGVAIARWATSSCVAQISFASCSTQPGFGKC